MYKIEDKFRCIREGGVGRRRRKPAEHQPWSVGSSHVNHDSICRLVLYGGARCNKVPKTTTKTAGTLRSLAMSGPLPCRNQ